MNNTEPNLKECPFCGGKAKYESSLTVTSLQDENRAYVDYDEMYYWERTYCTECGAEISSESEDEEEEITIAKWNNRADDTIQRKISCDERMPDSDGTYIVFSKDRTDIAEYDTEMKSFGYSDEYKDELGYNIVEFYELHGITHWMPIPN